MHLMHSLLLAVLMNFKWWYFTNATSLQIRISYEKTPASHIYKS